MHPVSTVARFAQAARSVLAEAVSHLGMWPASTAAEYTQGTSCMAGARSTEGTQTVLAAAESSLDMWPVCIDSELPQGASCANCCKMCLGLAACVSQCSMSS